MLITVGLLDMILGSTTALLLDPTYMRILRVVKVLRKLLRLVRLLRYFRELRLMMQCLMGTVFAVFWCIILVAGFTLFFAILFVQQFAAYLKDKTVPADELKNIYKSFGSVHVASISLFQCFTGGTDWGAVYDQVLPLGTAPSLLFLCYMVIAWLSLTNIITSVFVDKAVRCSQPDTDELVVEKRKDDLKVADELSKLFQNATKTGSNLLSLPELDNCLQDVHTETIFEMNGLTLGDAKAFCHMLALQSHGEVDLDTFIAGCLALKGPANSIDIVLLRHQLDLLEYRLQRAYKKSMRKHVQLLEQVCFSAPNNPASRGQAYAARDPNVGDPPDTENDIVVQSGNYVSTL